MRPDADRLFYIVYWLAAGVVLLFVSLRSWLVPLWHDEVATFYFYIHPGEFIPFRSHIDANGHFLTSALGWICYKLFGASPFSLRLPSLAALVLLCYAVGRAMEFFRTAALKTAFAASFLLVYTFLAYFSMARGYGISMACLVMALYYFFRFLENGRTRHFLKFSLFIQLALAANLTLVVVSVMCIASALFIHLSRKSLFRVPVAAAYLLHILLVGFWGLYAFYLRDHGALYYGAGESYWQVTFVSLIHNLFPDSPHMPLVFLVLFCCLAALWLFFVVRHRQLFVLSAACWSLFLFVALVVSFYALKAIAGVNYPEDRTGLFFYVFFMFAFCLLADRLVKHIPRLIGLALVLTGSVWSFRIANLHNHPWTNHETMPREFYDILVNEQKRSSRRITIGGHRMREFIYGFLNFRSEMKLNHMTSPEALEMNCDYALAVRTDEPWYREYYDVLAAEDNWGFRLLKRKVPLIRETLREFDKVLTIHGEPEYVNCFDMGDTLLATADPLQADVRFRVLKAPIPFRAWLVFQIDAKNPEENIFVRVPLDLVSHDWTKQGEVTLSLVTGTVPRHVKRMVLYLWNIEKVPIEMTVIRSSLNRLQGPGVNVVSKARL